MRLAPPRHDHGFIELVLGPEMLDEGMAFSPWGIAEPVDGRITLIQHDHALEASGSWIFRSSAAARMAPARGSLEYRLWGLSPDRGMTDKATEKANESFRPVPRKWSTHQKSSLSVTGKFQANPSVFMLTSETAG